MSKHIHIHMPARKVAALLTKDAGTAHDPHSGQFTKGKAQYAGGKAGAASEAANQSGTAAAHNAAAEAHQHAANIYEKLGSDVQSYRHDQHVAFHKRAAVVAARREQAPKPTGDSMEEDYPVKDATAHDPANGRFASGRPGSTAKKQPTQQQMQAHPNYHPADHEYLKGKGWTNAEIHARWTEEHGEGKPAQTVNKHNPPSIRSY